MDEQAQSLEDQLRDGMQRRLANVEDLPMSSRHDDRSQLLAATGEPRHGHGLASPLCDVAAVQRQLEHLQGFTHGLEHDRGIRDGAEVAIPDGAHLKFYAWEAERERETRYEGPDPGDPDYLGQQ